MINQNLCDKSYFWVHLVIFYFVLYWVVKRLWSKVFYAHTNSAISFYCHEKIKCRRIRRIIYKFWRRLSCGYHFGIVMRFPIIKKIILLCADNAKNWSVNELYCNVIHTCWNWLLGIPVVFTRSVLIVTRIYVIVICFKQGGVL